MSGHGGTLCRTPSAWAALRRQATHKATQASAGDQPPTDDSLAGLANAWLAQQRALPAGAAGKRAESTLAENERELEMLKKAFGHMPVGTIEKADGYAYLDACQLARDAKGNPRPRPEKGNKEISLARTVFEWGVRRRWLATNPFASIEKLVTERSARLVTSDEMALAVDVGRRMGGPQHIAALALRTAWLCLRRSVEVRALTKAQITERGIEWHAAKRQRGEAQRHGLIEWSAEPFSLQDCRPMGVTEKMGKGDLDTLDATRHNSDRMVRQTYDRRRLRVATPAR